MELEEKDMNFTNNNSHLGTKEFVERSTANMVAPTFAEPNFNGFSEVARNTQEMQTKLTESVQKKSPNLLSSAATSSPQVGNLTSTSTSASQHLLTPLSHSSKIRNSLGACGKTPQSLVSDVRRHSSAEGLLSAPGKRLVNFFHIGRIVPRKSKSPIMKNPIVFTRLGKLGPKLESSCIPSVLNESATCQMKTPMAVKETQTTPSALVSVCTQTEMEEAIETCVKETQTVTPVELVDEKKSLEWRNEQTQKEEMEEVVTVNELDECSEDAFMFAEPFKRARVLSSSEEENETLDTKRRKNSDSIDLLDHEPSLLPSSADLNTRMLDGNPEKPPQLESETVAVWKTVVMESDPESDGGDILAATPPPPPPVKIIPQRKVFTCSGLPVRCFPHKSCTFKKL